MRRGLGFHARHSPGGAFSPLSLFPAGANGAWYDPSDNTTLFTDRAGTTPCGTPGGGSVMPVGLMLDKSKGSPLAVGAHRYWRYIVGVSTSGHHPRVSRIVLSTATASTNIVVFLADNCADQGTIPTLGATYAYDFGSATAIVSASVYATFNGSRAALYQVEYSDDNTNWFSAFQGNMSATTCGLFAGSVFAYNGNHAIAANDTTARPELRARVNLLTYSEQFDNAAWTKTGGTITANADTAPDGTLTADLLTGNGTTFVAVQQSSGTLGTGRASFYVKAGTETKCEIWPNFGSSLARFDLSAVTATNTGGSNAAITAVGNGWFRISVDSSTFTANVRLILGYGAPTLSTTMLLWGAQLTATNEFPANTYQRIVDANTYDAVGFPRYFVANGTSSAMSTPGNVNLSGTDKVTVFAGVRALQASVQIINELGTDTNSVNGSYVLYKNNNGVGFASRGTAINDLNNSSGTTPPVSLVLAGQSNIAAPSISLRSNGAQVLSSTATQGTGNFGTYPLFIGARNNSSLFFTGNIYSIIVVGSAVSAGQISATEQWVAGKTGITI